MPVTVKVFSKNHCQPCNLTKKAFVAKDIAFTEVNIEDNPSAYDEAIAFGHSSAPIVVISDLDGNVVDSWGGMRPDKIRTIVDMATAAATVAA